MKQPTIEQVAAIAWDLVRDDADPLFEGCTVDHRSTLIYLAQNVASSGLAQTGFEQKAREVLGDPVAALAAIQARYGAPERPSAPVSEEEPLAEAPAKKKRGK